MPPLLFDLEADPLERENRAADPALAGEISRLRAAMLDRRLTGWSFGWSA